MKTTAKSNTRHVYNKERRR